MTNKISQNLHAELLLRLLGKVFGTEGSFEEGTRVVRQFMVNAGVDNGDFFLYDGSGMSPDDQIAPRAFSRLLSYASQQPWGEAWRATLPVAGVDGTLAGRFGNSPLKGHLWAKTGTMNEINALSGYLTAASGKTLAFSIMVNGHRPIAMPSPGPSTASPKRLQRLSNAVSSKANVCPFSYCLLWVHVLWGSAGPGARRMPLVAAVDAGVAMECAAGAWSRRLSDEMRTVPLPHDDAPVERPGIAGAYQGECHAFRRPADR